MPLLFFECGGSGQGGVSLHRTRRAGEEGSWLTRVNKVLFSNRVRSRFWSVVLVTTYLLSVSRSAAKKPLNVVSVELTRISPQSNGSDICRGEMIRAHTAWESSRGVAIDGSDSIVVANLTCQRYKCKATKKS